MSAAMETIEQNKQVNAHTALDRNLQWHRGVSLRQCGFPVCYVYQSTNGYYAKGRVVG